MSWIYHGDVGKVKDPHQLKKFLLKEFIHPDLVKDMKIKVNPAKMEFFYKGEIILTFVSDYFIWWKNPDKYKENIPSIPLDLDKLMKNFKRYYQQKHQQSAEDKDYYFRILALLDKRTGKRTLQKFLNNGDFFEVVVMNRDFRLEKLYKIMCSSINYMKGVNYDWRNF